MANETERAKEISDAVKKADEEKARKDAEQGENMDRLLRCLDSLTARMDQWDEAEKKKADAEAKAREESDPTKVVADAEGGDFAPDQPKAGAPMEPKMDSTGVYRDAYGDAVYRANHVKSRDQWKNDALMIQSRADRIYSVGGSKAPQICEGESLRDYRVRLLAPLKHTSNDYAKVDSADFGKLPASVFASVETTIYNDADKSGRNPIESAPDGSLREYYQTDAAGRRITCFAGTRSFIHDFVGEKRRLVGIRTNFND